MMMTPSGVIDPLFSLRNIITRPRAFSFSRAKSTINTKLRQDATTTGLQESNRVDPRQVLDRLDKFLVAGLNPDLRQNLQRRQVNVDFNKIQSLAEQVEKSSDDEIAHQLLAEVMKLPNVTHPASWNCSDDQPNVIYMHGNHDVKQVLDFHSFCKLNKDLARTDNLGNIAGHRAYSIKGPLAELEQALIRFTVEELLQRGFELLSVPDLLYPQIIESMGMTVRGERDQVYFLDSIETGGQEVCLSGTAEMAMGGFIKDKIFKSAQLPLRLAAVSRCFRAETSSLEEESGLYRVHYFTKVEMFGVTANETTTESDQLHREFLDIQQSLFRKLQVPYRALEMPPSELGLSAHRKFDIESWMPGKKMYGEISSCSNCTDFQSRRLNTRYISEGQEKFVHTVNGTACAIPRMLISLVENFQLADNGHLGLPPPVEKHMHRSWSESLASCRAIETNFLRTKSQMDRVTEEYF